MRFLPGGIDGVHVIELEPLADERGFFARTFCTDEFAAQGLETRFVQSSVSFNARRGTLRGMHYQAAPYEETKVVRCTRGAVYDVVLDLRPSSRTYGRWKDYELSAASGRALYIPAGCAHGFQTLEDESDVLYQMDVAYRSSAARGVRWNDPAFGILWPIADPILSPRDREYPDYRPDRPGA